MRLRENRIKKRIKVYELLGGKCNWPGCTWNDWMGLMIDHVNGDGYKERDEETRLYSGDLVLSQALKNPERFQLLCGSHHIIKTRLLDPKLREQHLLDESSEE